MIEGLKLIVLGTLGVLLVSSVIYVCIKTLNNFDK